MISIASYDIPDCKLDVAHEMYAWCEQHFGTNKFSLLYRTLYFDSTDDYTWFMMRWS